MKERLDLNKDVVVVLVDDDVGGDLIKLVCISLLGLDDDDDLYFL